MKKLHTNLKQNKKCLESLRLKNTNRKISKNCIVNIQNFLLL